jgi:hypothetical protein
MTDESGPRRSARSPHTSSPEAKKSAEDMARRESGQPGGGAGRRDEVGESGVHPMSAGVPPGKHSEIRTQAAWGQGERGAAGYDDAGGSELVMRDGQLLGGLDAGPSGEPTIDIHGADRPRDETRDARAEGDARAAKRPTEHDDDENRRR